MKFRHLILTRIIHIVATRRHIFRLRYAKSDFFSCRSTPDPVEGSCSAPQTH